MASRKITRRKFNVAASTAFAFTYIPKRVWGANDRFYVAGIGVGGKGAGEVKDITAAGGKFVALCDVDASRASKTFESFPDAKIYTDFREMLDKEKGIDAVSVSTPDHTHAIASLTAMAMGKHVYCQKPLTYTIHEARLMTRAAEHFKVKTQMGNQAHAGEPIRRAVELIRAGIIGPVREVHAWTNRPIWPQGAKALQDRIDLSKQPKPSDLDWDLWLGPAKLRDYNACYTPFKWRGWWDFGTGALGDMACHIMDMPYWALDLGAPVSVEAEAGGHTSEIGPEWSKITYQYAARQKVGGGTLGASVGPVAKVEQPAVKFVWYDGNRDGRPNAPIDLLAKATEEAKRTAPPNPPAESDDAKSKKTKKRDAEGLDSPSRWDLIMVGDLGTMLFKRDSVQWIISPGSRALEFANVPVTIPRVENEDIEWIQSCRGGNKALSSFDYAGPFTEAVVLGTLAIRLGKKIEWDSKKLRSPNAPEADALIRSEYRKGWELPVSDAMFGIG
ncbi:MAG: Gfo/Idh/MocA family oxidoreductase [Pirellulaceae bacterium]|nr:Gfo/Idh/MocA family oxidoreductase [Pirellulaceae bacterium]